MSKEVKIVDVFKLPMIIEGQCCVMSADFRYQINLDDSDSNAGKQAECICEAINNHDRLVEENKRLREALSHAYELLLISGWDDYYADKIRLITNLLEGE